MIKTYNDKDKEVWYKLIDKALYGKTMKSVRNKIIVKLVNNIKDYFKCTSKRSYMSHKIFTNNLVAMRKSNLTLKLNKPAYTRTLIHCDYIKNKYGNKSKLLFTDSASLMYEIKNEDVYEEFIISREMLDFSN